VKMLKISRHSTVTKGLLSRISAAKPGEPVTLTADEQKQMLEQGSLLLADTLAFGVSFRDGSGNRVAPEGVFVSRPKAE